jgi:hypothetical protein
LGRTWSNKRRHVQENVDTPELAMGLLDGADDLVFVGGIGSDRDRTHSSRIAAWAEASAASREPR